jgi:hypothetical protein
VPCRPCLKGKVAWVTEESSSLQTSICPSCYAVNASFIVSCASSIVNLRTRFLLRGEGCNTLCYGSPNLSLITVINRLVMPYMLLLINSESSQGDCWFNLKWNHRTWENNLLIWTSNSYPWVGWTLGAISSPCSKFHPSSKFQEETIVNSLKF